MNELSVSISLVMHAECASALPLNRRRNNISMSPSVTPRVSLKVCKNAR